MTRNGNIVKYYENVEKIFNEDVRDKRKTGRGAFSMRGKGVKHGISGALRTPYHFMTNREKKKLNGEVKVFQMYETVIPFIEFDLKDEETQKLMLTRWRELYSNKKIKEELKINNTQFYNLVTKLDVPKKVRKPVTRNKTTAEKSTAIKAQTNHVEKEETKQEIEQEVVKQMVISKGMNLEYFGEYDAESLIKILTKLQLLLDDEKNNFHIRLSLSEIEKSGEKL